MSWIEISSPNKCKYTLYTLFSCASTYRGNWLVAGKIGWEWLDVTTPTQKTDKVRSKCKKGKKLITQFECKYHVIQVVEGTFQVPFTQVWSTSPWDDAEAQWNQDVFHHAARLFLDSLSLDWHQFFRSMVAGAGELDVGSKRPGQRHQNESIRFQRPLDLFQQTQRPSAAIQQVQGAYNVVTIRADIAPSFNILNPVKRLTGNQTYYCVFSFSSY